MMLMCRLKPLDEIFSQLQGFRSFLLLACNGCERQKWKKKEYP